MRRADLIAGVGVGAAVLMLLAGCRPASTLRTTTALEAGAAQGRESAGIDALPGDIAFALPVRTVDPRPLNTLQWHAGGARRPGTIGPSARLDLQAEPLVIHVPTLPAGRHYALHLLDLQANAFAHIGSLSTGNLAGRFLLAGPGWHGQIPAGITGVIRADSGRVTLSGWLQRFEADTTPQLQRLQAGYRVQPLSRFLGTEAPYSAMLALEADNRPQPDPHDARWHLPPSTARDR